MQTENMKKRKEEVTEMKDVGMLGTESFSTLGEKKERTENNLLSKRNYDDSLKDAGLRPGAMISDFFSP
ncbi:hypothetical protein RB195_005343 [Necator americanus]|uniref:Uncharacterized protein n=1 Tax=Necator americanus TaxID=51031 RepID=A0ABR1BME3_NECAM